MTHRMPQRRQQGLKDFEAFAWQGLVVPAGGSTAVKGRLESLGVEPMPGGVDEMARFARAECERWGRLIRANGIRLD